MRAEAGPPGLPAPDPEGVTYYRWEDIRAAGRLDWAWAIASDHGNLEQIEALLADGVDPDTRIGGDYTEGSNAPKEGLYRTALIEAAAHRYDDVAERLLEAGADPTMHEQTYVDGKEEGRGGDTALHEAASNGDAALVRKLLAAGAAADAEGFDGYTPLFSAQNDLETFELLLAAGANLEKAGGLDRLFDSTRDIGVGAYLLERGASVEGEGGKRQDGYTPLWSAVTGGRPEMVRFLLKHGADPSITTASGDSLLDLARQRGDGTIVDLLERALAGESLGRPAEAPP